MELIKTPLYDRHVAAGGQMTPYAGYLLPAQYTGIGDEHMAVRSGAGLFDVSHMGELVLSGSGASQTLDRLLTLDAASVVQGRVRYSLMCNEDGGILDDLLVYRLDCERFLLVVNACNHERDAEWVRAHLCDGTTFEDISADTAQLALQGRRSADILGGLTDPAGLPTKYYGFADGLEVAGVRCLVSRTGYTGEHGYELYCPADRAEALWDAITDAGLKHGLKLCGLGARDTLRLEAGMPLYGHEMSESITPFETGLGFAVKMEKPDFLGKDALVRRGPPKVARIGLKVTGRGVARADCGVYAQGVSQPVGKTTSGTFLPYMNGSYAMALVDTEHCGTGNTLELDVRGRRIAAEVVPLPFYKSN